MAKKTETKELSFEAALQRLEELANELDSGELKLEDAIKKYEEGVKLYANCQEILAKAEKKVQMLVRDADGKLAAVPFDAEDSSSSDTDKDSSEESDDASTKPPRTSDQSSRSKKTNLF